MITPCYSDVEAAASRIEGQAHITPVLTSRTINSLVGADVLFKCENFQRTGSFKFRGAYNALSKLNPEQRAAGVVACSSGNHAQGIALAGQLLQISTTIVMPKDAPASKVAATRRYGAKIFFYDRYTEDREAIARNLVAAEGLTMIPPYDHPDVLVGQGTSARELIRSAGHLDSVLVSLGGGGMLSGTALAVKELLPHASIYGVEPEAGNDGQQSFRSRKIIHIDTPNTIADGAQTRFLGDHTFPIILDAVTDVLTVTDEELVEAMILFANHMKIVVEPTGCLGLAALLKYRDMFRGRRIGIIITGGNVDTKRFVDLVCHKG